ncbi:MAG: hypothetical protein AAF108_02370 [Planctomycetota bacterium]
MTRKQANDACTPVLVAALLSALGFALAGCAPPRQPDVLVAPYDTLSGDVLWAVAPLTNESGDLFVEPGPVAEALTAAAEQVVGIAVVPAARTRSAMLSLGLRSVSTPEQASALARAVGADAIILGSITHHSPYDPPRLGLALALTSTSERTRAMVGSVELGGLRTALTGGASLPGGPPGPPNATVSAIYDARNEQTRLEIDRYARGRTPSQSVMGVDEYTQSFGLFTQFVAHSAVRALLDEERLRFVRAAAGREQNRP